jgi:hypothetical protein
MPNVLGALAPSLVAQRTLDYLKQMFPPALRMFVDFSEQRVQLNQSVTTRIPGASNAYNVQTAGYVAPDITDVDVPVTVNRFFATSIAFSTVELSSTNRDLINEHAAAAANKLGSELIAHMCSLFVTANYPFASLRTIKASASYDDATIRGIRKKLNSRSAPQFARLGIVNSDAFEALSGDSRVVTLDTNPNAHEDFALNPPVLKMRGFDVMEFPSLPANSVAVNGVFLAPGAVIGAVGVPTDANADGMFPGAPSVVGIEYVTDPDTGLSLIQRLHKNAQGGIQMDLAWIYGFSKGNTNCAEIVTAS